VLFLTKAWPFCIIAIWFLTKYHDQINTLSFLLLILKKRYKMKRFVNCILATMILAIFMMMDSGCKKDDTEEETGGELTSDQSLPYIWKNWMGELSDTLSLNQITIPGTHDAGADKHTSGLGFATAPYVIAQDFSIPNQLNLGVRALDIRLSYEDGDLIVHHSSFSLNKNFKDVLHYCVTFLNDHPSETIILMIKQEHSDVSDVDFSERVYHQIEDRGLYNFFIHDRVPKLGEVRGLIYIVRRFHKEFDHPLGVYASWQENTTGSYVEHNGVGWYVQDHYSLHTVSTETKFSEVKHCIALAHEEVHDNVFHINFVSGERVPDQTLWETASEINPLVDGYIKGVSHPNCGVIMINMAGGGDVDSGSRNCVPNFVKHIIERNGIDFKSTE
jgi:1-phosphatidylinositol phosphodiesterase